MRYKAEPSKIKVKTVWTCSDNCQHEHKYRWTAWLCGRIQYLKRLAFVCYGKRK